MERKLAAIFSTDVKGYSRLMGDDEEATIHTLKTYREVISGLIEQHHGRVVDSPGDNMLAEFASAVDAVKSAVVIQKELKTRNAELEAHRQMEFRIGLNVGDVITDEGRLYGDGVNIAARLEGLADPGGICISANVHEQVRNKLSLACEYIGEREVKNIATPVRVYKVQLESDGTATPAVSQQPAPSPVQETGPSRRWPMAALAIAAMLVVGAGMLVRHDASQSPSILQESLPAEESSVLPLPDKPSIAVLPFTNMSGDPEQEYFSDGLTDTLITDLSQLSGLFVIARNSVFIYKGTAVKMDDVSKELGVRYVVEGGVQKMGDRLRINVQLIDATTGGHLWAERYDRELPDIFAVQDEVIQKVVTALAVRLTAGEAANLARFPTDNPMAYDYFLRGLESYHRFRKEANTQARQLFEQALTLDPQYAAAYAQLSFTHWTDWYSQWAPGAQALKQAFETAYRAVSLNDSLSPAHIILGIVYLWQKRYELAFTEAEKAITLNPNDASAYWTLGFILNYVQRYQDALGAVEQAMRLNPHYPPYYLLELGKAYRFLGQSEEAMAAQQGALARNPNFLPARLQLAGLYSEAGREEEARTEAGKILRLSSNFSLEVHRQSVPYKDPVILERYIDSLRKAGLK